MGARAAVVAAILLASGPGHANGRFPASASIDFRPGHPEDIAVGATFGLLVSRDDGATWRWYCEAAVGFEGTYDPHYLWSATGALFASTFAGLKVTRDACAWQAVPGPVGTANVTALAIGGDGAIWAGVTDPVLGAALYRSVDDGQTFTATTLPAEPTDVWSSIAVAPGAATRVYVTGRRMIAGEPARILYRTDDGGATWDALATDALVGTASSELLLAAIDPADPDHAYAILTNIATGLRTALYRSDDLGAATPTWTQVLEEPTRINGVAVRASGEILAITPALGLHRSTDRGLTFAPVPGVTLDGRCLRERPDGTLWMCTNNLPPDSATLHVATDAASWTRQLRFAELAGPARCPNGTLQREVCEATLWCGVRENLDVRADETGCVAPPDAGVDAPGPSGGDRGCCSTGAAPGLELGIAALGLLVRRRRRQPARAAR